MHVFHKMTNIRCARLCSVLFCLLYMSQVHAYESGSTGADGALSPVENTVVELPVDGILNYTSINIPSGVRVSFKKNATNTPVRLLVSGDVFVGGVISVSGGHAPDADPEGDGNTADDGDAGVGGPGGYDGGRGGRVRPSLGNDYSLYSAEDALAVSGEWGHGPGGGAAGRLEREGSSYVDCGATGGNFSNLADIIFFQRKDRYYLECTANRINDIEAYGNNTLLPLVGGSGGGGDRARFGVNGAGGGGGGGALLIAASGAVNITGFIIADGGDAGTGLQRSYLPRYNSGGGSGGAIRIIATTVIGNGVLSARAGEGAGGYRDVPASDGRIRIEAERMRFSGWSLPQYTLGRPGSLYFEGRPSVRIVSVGEQNVPARPSGSNDITFANALTSAVSISLQASNVPLGTVVTVNVVPVAGDLVRVDSTPLAGSVASSTATATVSLPAGPSVLQPFTGFELQPGDAALQAMYTPYTGGELVAQVSLDSAAGGEMTLVTVSGRTIVVPGSVAR